MPYLPPHENETSVYATPISPPKSISSPSEASPSTPRVRTIPLPPDDEPPVQVQMRIDEFNPGTVRINSFLEAAPAKFILYDFSPPTGVTIAPENPLFVLTVSEPATHPPLPSLTVVCPQLDRSFIVPPHSLDPGAFVTVLDVLRELHSWLQLKIHREDYETLSLSTQAMVLSAYETRCARILDPMAQAFERQKGPKRVDLLFGLHVFAGLSSTPHGPDIWELHLCAG